MGKLSAPSTITSQPAPRIRSAFSVVRRSAKTSTVTSGLSAAIVSLRRLGLRVAEPLRRVDDLALEVRLVHDVVVDDPERPDAGRREVERRRGAEPAGADEEHARVQQLLLAGLADLGDQEVAAVAAALLGVEGLRDLDGQAVALPVGEPAGQRDDVDVAELLERLGGEGRAAAGGAVDDERLRRGRGAALRRATRASRGGCAARPGMWPSSHSARSRTSTKIASPASRRSRADGASVSSISARTWARRSR